jgi:hypothetical protein
MSGYTVTWLEMVQSHLAQIWIDATDRQAITAAANLIDKELANNPFRKGTGVSEGLRSLDVPPLHVLFEVRELDRLVEIVSIRRDDNPFSPPLLEGNGTQKS